MGNPAGQQAGRRMPGSSGPQAAPADSARPGAAVRGMPVRQRQAAVFPARLRPGPARREDAVWRVVLAGLFLIVTVAAALFQTVSAVLMYGQMGMLAYVPWGAVCAQILVRYLPLILIEIVIIILARRKGSK